MQFYWSDPESRGQSDDCESLAPFVMALFDGEADEIEAKRARAHLVVCQTCAQRWLDWNRSRDLLLSVTVPAPPPTLLWRVLMACRLAAFTKKSKTVAKAPTHRAYSDALSSDASSAAPDSLSAQILARTTRVTAPIAVAPVSVAPVASTVSKKRHAFPAFAMPSLAVPALALFLMMTQRDTLFVAEAPEPDTYEENSYVLPTPERSKSRLKSVSVSHTPKSAKKLVQPKLTHETGANPDAVEAGATEANATEADGPELDSHPVEVRYERPNRAVEREGRSPRGEGREDSDREDSDREDREAAPVEQERGSVIRLASFNPSESRPAAPTPIIEAVPRPHLIKLPAKPASLSDKRKAPRLRAAHWELATPRVARIVETASDAEQGLRVSLPPSRSLAGSTRSTLPGASRPSSESFDSGDADADELRSAVDDFRATLASEQTFDPEVDDLTG